MNIDVSNIALRNIVQNTQRKNSFSTIQLNPSNGFNTLNTLEKQLKSCQVNVTYTNPQKNTNTYISNTILNSINFDTESVTKHGTIFSVNGVEFEACQIPEVSSSQCKTAVVTDNKIVFQANSYYNYTDITGEVHQLVCNDGYLSALFSESLKGNGVDTASNKYAQFWNIAGSEDPTFIGMNFSKDEIESYFSEAGIEPGFYTVSIGGKEYTNYYTEGEHSSGIIPKAFYDDTYYAMSERGGFFSSYEPGSIFKIGDESYVLNDDYTLDLPYGADIDRLVYPSSN